MTGNRLLEREAIAARIPHAGRMCLLDHVLAWDEHHIKCIGTHHGAAHPLAVDGRLPATAAIEYAAQAMALHGSLVQERLTTTSGSAPAAPRRGFLAGLRSVQLHCRWIEPGWPALTVRVERYAGDEVQVLYDFEVCGTGPIVQGRAVVVLDAGARGPARGSLPSAPSPTAS
jgi:predicted hotdog family 3-hydroxylacyl-ACP dehydratase